MNTRKRMSFVVALLLSPVLQAFGASGNLTIFDDADENGFNMPAATCDQFSTLVGNPVHSGTMAVAVLKTDNAGGGWQAPVTYSAESDYDGVEFWINAGSQDTTLTSLAIIDGDGDYHFAHLEDSYGGPLPADTWVQFKIPFASSLFATAQSSSPTTVQTICIVNHSDQGSYLYIDDVALTGADIFKNGFE